MEHEVRQAEERGHGSSACLQGCSCKCAHRQRQADFLADGAGVDESLRQQRLPHPSGPARQELEDKSFLSVSQVKEAARIWIRSQLKARRAKAPTSTPSTIASFRSWCSSVLLKPRIDEDPNTSPSQKGLLDAGFTI